MNELTDRFGYDFDASANSGLGFAEFYLKAQAVSVRLYPSLKLVTQFDLQHFCLSGFDPPTIGRPPQDNERGYE